MQEGCLTGWRASESCAVRHSSEKIVQGKQSQIQPPLPLLALPVMGCSVSTITEHRSGQSVRNASISLQSEWRFRGKQTCSYLENKEWPRSGVAPNCAYAAHEQRD